MILLIIYRKVPQKELRSAVMIAWFLSGHYERPFGSTELTERNIKIVRLQLVVRLKGGAIDIGDDWTASFGSGLYMGQIIRQLILA